MKLEVFLVALALSGALGFRAGGIGRSGGWGSGRPGGWRGGPVVSKRSTEDGAAGEDGAGAAEESEDEPDLYSLVDSLLQSARNGITADDLGEAASNIQKEADNIVDSREGQVDPDDVQAVIDAAAHTFQGNVAVTSLFADPLTYEASKMDAALNLLNSLATTAKQQDDAGESSTATVAAISITAQAIQKTVIDSVATIIYVSQESDEKNVNKRLEVEGPYSTGSIGGKVSHSLRRKRSGDQIISKRGWSGSLHGKYSRGGNYQIGAGVTYSWGR